jgi:copper transport protein
MGRERRDRLRIACLLALVVAMAALSTPVAAHAYLSESDPANGERVETLPEAVTLSFSGDGVQLAEVEVRDADGEDVSGEATIDPDDSRTVVVPIEGADEGGGANEEGVYTVEWEVLADDGHTTAGTFLFTVGDEPLDREHVLELHADGEDEEPSIAEIPAKGGLLLALVALVGTPVTLAAAVHPVSERFGVGRERLDRRANAALLGAACLFVLSAFSLGLVRAASTTGLSAGGLATFAGLGLGRAWLAQLAIGAGLVGILWLGRRGRLLPNHWLAASVAGGVAAMAVVAATGHSASFEGFPGIAVHLGHLVGGALWVGGLAVLALFVPALLDGHAEARTAAAAIVRRFSVVAVAGVALAFASGLVLAAWHVPDPGSLGTTTYGRALSVKLALLGGAVGLGGLNRFVLGRRLRDEPGRLGPLLPDGGTPLQGFTRSVRLEAGLLVAVILVSGLVTAAPTASMATDEGAGEVTMEAGEHPEVELSLLPAEAGPNVVDVTIAEEGEPVTPEGDEVTLLVREEGGSALPQQELDRRGEGSYSTVVSLASGGSWELRVDFWHDDEYVTETFAVEIDAGDAAEDDLDHGDDEPSLFGNALVILALWVGLLGVAATSYEAARVRDEP